MKFHVLVWAAAAFGLVSIGAAQTAAPEGETGSSSESADNQELWALIERRAKLAGDVVAGKESPEDALTELRTLALPAAFRGDADADFAQSAIDVGQRLHAAGQDKDAGLFFQAADESLTGALGRARESDAAALVQLFSSRAFIRAQFLGKVPEAIADLDAAQKLAQDDTYLQDLRRQLLSDKAAWLVERTQD